MRTTHLIVAGVVVTGLSSGARAGSVSLAWDHRHVEASAWAGDPSDPVERTDRSEADTGADFESAIDLAVQSRDATTLIAAYAEQDSRLRFDDSGGFELTGSLVARTATAFLSDGEVFTADGFGYPLSVFDVEINTDLALAWELEVRMATDGDAATSFAAFDFVQQILATGGNEQTFVMSGSVGAGRHRVLADVLAPTDPFFGGSSAELSFTLRASPRPTAAVPMPTALGAAAVLCMAAALRRRGSGG